MRRLAFPLSLVIVVSAVAATLIVYAVERDDASAPPPPTPFVGSDGDPTCADADIDGAVHGGNLSIDEARERLASLMGRSIPVPGPPTLGWRPTIGAGAVALYSHHENADGVFESRTVGVGGAVSYEPNDGAMPYVTVVYQPLPRCELFNQQDTTGVSTGSTSVEVRYFAYRGGRSSSLDNDEFNYEAVAGTFDLPDDPLTVVITLEWDEAFAPTERIRVVELENWTRAILSAAYPIEQ